MNQESPVRIGTEVEMPFATQWPNDEVHAAADKYCTAHRMGTGLQTILYVHPDQKFETDKTETLSGGDRQWAVHPWETIWPKRFRSPDGWERGWESAHEFRFRGPAETIRETFRRYDTLQVYFDSWKNRPQHGYGTHIHMGVRDWLHEKFGAPTTGEWFASPVAKLVYGYLIERLGGIAKVNAQHRGVQYPFSSSPLYQIHNRWAQGTTGRSSTAITSSWLQGGRKSLPTFEARMFTATNKMAAVKGYAALLISMLKRAESLMTKELIAASQATIDNTKGSLTTPFYGPGYHYSVDHMKDEVRETGFWVAPLISWIDETVKNNGEPTPFEGSLYEIYDTIPDTGEKVTNFELPPRNSVGKRQVFEAASPLAAAA